MPPQVQDDVDEYLKRYTQKKVRDEARKQGVPVDYIERQAEAESAFRPDVITGRKQSSAGAIGTMQLMPGTAKDLGVNPYHIDQNIEGGVRYSKQMLDRYKGDQQKAAAAYNWGPGNVDRKGLANAPAETRVYQQKVAERQGDDVDEFLSRWKKQPATKKEQRRQNITALQDELTATTPQVKPGNTLNVTTGRQYPTPSPKPFQSPIDLRLNAPNEAQKAFDRAAAATQPAPPPKPRNAFQAPQPKPMLERVMAQQAIERQQPQTVETDPQRLEQLRQTTAQQLAEQRDVRIRQSRADVEQMNPLQRMAVRGLAKAGGASNEDIRSIAPPQGVEADLMRATNAGVRQAGSIIRGAGEALPGFLPSSAGALRRPIRQGVTGAVKDIQGGVQTAVDTLAPDDPADQSFRAKLGRGVGSVGASMGGALATGGGSLAAGTLGALGNLGQVAEERERSGVPVSGLREAGSDALAIATGMTEALGAGRLLNRLGMKTPVIQRVAQALEEGGQEYAQGYLNDINAKLVAAYDPNRAIDDPLSRKRLEEALIGTILGSAGEVADVSMQRAMAAQQNAQQRATRSAIDQRSAANATAIAPQPVAAQPVTDPLTEPMAAQSQPSAPVTPQAQPQGFPRLPEPENFNARRAKLLEMPTPAEVGINEQVQAAAQLLDSPNEGDQRQGRRMMNQALTSLRKAEGYLAEASLPPDAERPFTALRDAIEARLKPAPKVKEVPASQVPSSSAVEATTPTAANALRAEADAAKIKAAEFEQVGDFTQAAATYQAAHQNLKRLRQSIGRPRTPEAVAQINQLDREISIADANRRKAMQAGRTAQRQANAPTAGLEATRKKNAEKLPSSQPADSAPLLRPDVVQNAEPTNRLREAEYEGGEVQRYSKPLEGQPVEREAFQPDTADLREVREFTKREPRAEQFTDEPPTAPLARRRAEPQELPQVTAMREREALPPIERREAKRQAVPKGMFGKLSESSYKGRPNALVENPQLRRLLGLGEMPEYRLPDAPINPKTGEPYVNPEWTAEAQNTLNALAGLAGKERSSQIDFSEGARHGVTGKPTRSEFGEAFGALTRLARQKGERIDPNLRLAFEETGTRARSAQAGWQEFTVDERTENIRQSLYDTYREGKLDRAADKALRDSFQSIATEYGLSNNQSADLYRQTREEARRRAERAGSEPSRSAATTPSVAERGERVSGNRGRGESATSGRAAEPVAAQSEVREPAGKTARPAKSIDAQIKDIRDLQAFDLIDDKEAKQKIAALEAQRPKITERRSEAMPERYTGRQLFENAQLTFRPARNRPATLVANDWGGAMLNRLLSEKFDVTTTDANFTIGAKDAKDLRDYLADAKDSGIYEPAQVANMDAMLKQMDAAIADAEANQQDVAFVTRRPAEPISATKAKIRHEAAHLSQSRIAADLSALTGKNWLDSQPNAKDIHKELDRRGYAPETHDYEAAAFVASGDYGVFGMNLDQAAKFLSDYFGAVVEKHGKRALQKFGAIDPKLQPILEAARRETEAGRTENQRRSSEAAQRNERRIGAAGEARGSSAGVRTERRERRQEAAGSRPARRGQVLASGLGAFQNLFERDAKPKEVKPAPLPKDFDLAKWSQKSYNDALVNALSSKDRAEYNSLKTAREKQAFLFSTKIDPDLEAKVFKLIDRAAEAYEKGDGTDFQAVRDEVRSLLAGQVSPSLRDVKWYDHLQSRLSNVNFKGTYERIAGEQGKEISEIFRNAQVDAANGKITRAEAVTRLQRELKPYVRRLKSSGTPGLARWVESHIDAVSDPDQSFKGLAGFLRGFQYNTKLRLNPRSALINTLQPFQTLWPHLTTAEWLRIQRDAAKPSTWKRVGEVAAQESGGSVEEVNNEKRFLGWADLFSPVSKYNRIVGHLAGELFADRNGLTGDAKARMAADWAKKVEFDNSAYDIPPLFSGKIAGVVGQFKPFMVKNLERLYTDWKSAPPEALATNSWKGAGTIARRSKMITAQLLIGGVRSAIPGLKTIGGVLVLGALAKGFGRFMDDDEAEKLAEAVYFGAPALIEQDLSGSVAIFDEPFGKTGYEKMVNFAGGPTLSLIAKAYEEGKNINEAEDSKTQTKEEKQQDAALRLAKAVTPYTKWGIAGAAAMRGERPSLWLGKEVPMTKAETVGYSLLGTPLRQSKYYEHKEAFDWQKNLMPDRFEKENKKTGTRILPDGKINTGMIRQKVGEPEAVYKQRVERVEGWMSEYGDKLLSHPRYGTLTEAQQEAAIESLRRRIGAQQNATRPRLDGFAPEKVIQSVLKSEATRPKREAEKLWSPPANRP